MKILTPQFFAERIWLLVRNSRLTSLNYDQGIIYPSYRGGAFTPKNFLTPVKHRLPIWMLTVFTPLKGHVLFSATRLL